MDAPVHRLLAFVDEPLIDEPAECPRDSRLILEVHREIWVFPIPEDTDPLELLGHGTDEPLGVRPACTAEVRRRHLSLFRSQLAIDLELDRQTMTVITGDVRGVE